MAYPSNTLDRVPKSSVFAIVIVLVFLIIKRSAAYMGFPPLWGGEITIIVFSCLFLRRKTISAFIDTQIGLVVFLFILLPIPYILYEINNASIKYIEHASVCYYAIFLFFGYAAIDSRRTNDFFIKIIYWGILFSTLHYIIANIIPLREITPKINGVSILGHNDSGYIHYVFGFAYCVIYFHTIKPVKLFVLLTVVIIAYLIHFQRAPILGFCGCAVILWVFRAIWHRRIMAWQYLLLLLFLGTIISLGVILNIYVPSFGIVEKVQNQKKLVISIFDESAGLEAKEGTKQHRLDMWKEVYEETAKKDLIFGQGFKEVLTSASFRHPHNSFLTIFGRVGLLGLSLALVIYIIFPGFVLSKINRATDAELKKSLLLFACFVPAFLSGALFGPTLESPYSALVCNFMYGVMLRVYCLSKGNAQYAWH